MGEAGDVRKSLRTQRRKAGREARRAGRGLATLARLLHDARERARFRRALREPGEMRPRYKYALVTAIVLGAAATWAIGSLALRSAAPEAARGWDLAWGLGAATILTTVFPPLSYEAVLFAVRDASGAVVAVLASSVGVALGSALVFFIGGAAREKMEPWKAKAEWLRRFLDGLERFAKRYGYPGLFALTVIPLFPDSVPIYLFSIARLKLAPFVATLFLSTIVRSTVVLLFARELGLVH